MTPLKKLYEVLILGAIWAPIATVLFFMVDKMEDIRGEDWTVYGAALALVVIGFIATEYILESVRVDSAYSPD